ncbi:hypothetical protein F4775DRAFT_566978 [Biscogniauxia sp. FL1348]|nr:hypothetical protein F4775DRAFT_566978 [Biscogniauxia sp. FL1348]
MSFKKLALALVSTGYLAAAATLGQRSPADLAQVLAETVIEGPFPINSTTSGLAQRDEEGGSKIAKRADCWNGGSINTDDIQNLGSSRQSAGGNNYVPAASWVSYTWGSAKVCVLNNYLFDNTHVSDWEIGWGVLAVRNDCCFTPYCGGGLQQGHGDSGLAVNIVVRSAGESC